MLLAQLDKSNQLRADEVPTSMRLPTELRDLLHAVAGKLHGDSCITRLSRCNIGLGTGSVTFLCLVMPRS